MATTQASGNRSTMGSGNYPVVYVDNGAGWRAFAGTMILIGASLNFIDGIVAIANASYFRHVSGQDVSLPVTDNIHTWGWVAVVGATVMVFAGFAILAGAMWGRVLGVIAASLNLIFQLSFLAHFPFWSFTMILIDILVIYGLVVHGNIARDAGIDLTE